MNIFNEKHKIRILHWYTVFSGFKITFFIFLEQNQVAILKQIKPVLNMFDLWTPKAEKRHKSLKEHAKTNCKRQIKIVENTVNGITQNCCSSQFVQLKWAAMGLNIN